MPLTKIEGRLLGNVSFPGVLTTNTLAVSGDVTVNTAKMTVSGATGNTVVAGTLGITGDLAVNTSKLTVSSSTGNMVVAGTLGVTSDLSVNTSKFTVIAASGNTSVAGTLGVSGAAAFSGYTASSYGIRIYAGDGNNNPNALQIFQSNGSAKYGFDLGLDANTGDGVWRRWVNDVATEAFRISRAAGVLTVSGFGAHSLDSSGTGVQGLLIRNSTAGTGNYSHLHIATDATGGDVYLQAYSSTFSTSGPTIAKGVGLRSMGDGGLSISAESASGQIRFYTGGTTYRGGFPASGGFVIASGSYFYLDGGGNTFLTEISADRLGVYVGGNLSFDLYTSSGYSAQDFGVYATKRFYLDGGGDTYMTEVQANVIAIYTGGTRFSLASDIWRCDTDNSAALGGNGLRWTAVWAVNGTIQTSDRTRKTDIMAFTLQNEFLRQLRPVSFRMKDEAIGTQRHGLIAQDVLTAANGASLLGILTGEEGSYGLNYAGLVPSLIAGWQSHDTELTTLKAEVAELKARLARYESL